MKAVETAARLALVHEAELILNHVVQVPAIAEQVIGETAKPGAKPKQVMERLSGEILRAAIRHAEESGLDSGLISTLSAEGERVKRITEAATRLEADLMVLGCGGAQGNAIGGTAHRVMAQARCPCLIVP